MTYSLVIYLIFEYHVVFQTSQTPQETIKPQKEVPLPQTQRQLNSRLNTNHPHNSQK